MNRTEHEAAPRAPVMVLNYNGWRDTFATLAALEPQSHEVWLIDNGSPIDRCDEAQARFPGLRVLRLADNLGWAGGYNHALRVAAAEGVAYAYILNNDATPHAGAVAAAVATVAGADDVAAVGSVILEGDGRQVWFDGAYRGSDSLDVADLDRALRPVRAPNGAGFALSVAAWAAVGPFHEPYFLYHDEVDWFVRAGAAGWRLFVDGASLVTHAREGSDAASNARYYRVRNRYLARRRGVSVSGDRETWLSLTGDALALIATLPGEARNAAQNGLLDGLLGRFAKRSPPHPRFVLAGLTAIGQLALFTWRRILRPAALLVGKREQIGAVGRVAHGGAARA